MVGKEPTKGPDDQADEAGNGIDTGETQDSRTLAEKGSEVGDTEETETEVAVFIKTVIDDPAVMDLLHEMSGLMAGMVQVLTGYTAEADLIILDEYWDESTLIDQGGN